MTEIPPKLIRNLSSVGLSDWRYYPVVTSTNDLALTWAGEGAPDYSLVIADEQTAGRGRENRKWVTHPGAALAFSLILRPTVEELKRLPRFTALAALSLLHGLEQFGLMGALKWPNDVLLAGRKVAGVLVEADWQGDRLAALVVGMGVNITPAAVPPDESLRFPGTSVQAEVGQKVERWALLASILHTIKQYRCLLTTSEFIRLWNDRLAFRGETIAFRFPDGEVKSLKVLGVEHDGRLALRTRQGQTICAVAGEIEMTARDSERVRKAD